MTVLCVDDHPVLLSGLEQNVRLAAPGADIHSFTNSKDALSYAEGHGCDVLLTEIELYNHGGMRLAEQIAEELRNLRYPVPDAPPGLRRACV